MNSTLITAENVRISRRRSGSSAFTMRLLSMCFVKKTSGVGPRRARRCASYSSRFRSVSDTARLCGCRRAPILSICCPAIAVAAIAHLTYFLLLNFRHSPQRTNRAGIAIGGRDFVVLSCLSPERRWDNPGPITCLLFTELHYFLCKEKLVPKLFAPPASSRFATADSASLPAHRPQPASSSKPRILCSGQPHGTHPSPAGPPVSGS